jgi:hypothetical protein
MPDLKQVAIKHIKNYLSANTDLDKIRSIRNRPNIIHKPDNYREFIRLYHFEEMDQAVKNLKKLFLILTNELQQTINTIQINSQNQSEDKKVEIENEQISKEQHLIRYFGLYSFNICYYIESYITNIHSYKSFLNMKFYDVNLFQEDTIKVANFVLNKRNYSVYTILNNNISYIHQLIDKIQVEYGLEFNEEQINKFNHFYSLVDHFGSKI